MLLALDAVVTLKPQCKIENASSDWGLHSHRELGMIGP